MSDRRFTDIRERLVGTYFYYYFSSHIHLFSKWLILCIYDYNQSEEFGVEMGIIIHSSWNGKRNEQLFLFKRT